MIRTPQAKQLCNKSELELYSTSLSRAVKTLSEKELRASIQRSRKARDTFRSLAERQRREARGKQEAKGKRPSKSAQRTVTKVQLFDETLKRYQHRLTEVQAQTKSSAVTKKTVKKTPANKKTTKKKAAKKSPLKTKATKKKAVKKKAAKKKSVVKSKDVKAIRRRKKSVSKYPKSQAAKKKGKKPATSTKSRVSIRQTRKVSGLVRKQKHVSAQGRRGQSRRDSR